MISNVSQLKKWMKWSSGPFWNENINSLQQKKRKRKAGVQKEITSHQFWPKPNQISPWSISSPPSPPTLLPSPTKNKMQSRNKSDTNKRKQSININDNFNRFGSRAQYNKNPNPNHHKKKEEIRISSTIQQLNRREILMKLSSDRQFQLRQMTPAAN